MASDATKATVGLAVMLLIPLFAGICDRYAERLGGDLRHSRGAGGSWVRIHTTPRPRFSFHAEWQEGMLIPIACQERDTLLELIRRAGI